jgi:hypothetical protein
MKNKSLINHATRTSMTTPKLALLIFLAWCTTAVSGGAAAGFEFAKLFNNDPEFYEFPPRPARVFVAAEAAGEGRTLLVYRYGLESDPSGNSFKTFATNYVVLVDSKGEAVWTNRTLPFVFDLATTQDGGAYLLGNTMYVSSVPANQNAIVSPTYFSNLGIPTEGNGSAYIARLSPSGRVESVRYFGNSQFLAGTSIDRDGAGQLYVAGYYIRGGTAPPQIGNINLPQPATSTPNIFLVKLDSAGEVKWLRVGKGTAAYPAFNVRVWEPVRVNTSKAGYAILTIRDTFVRQNGYAIDDVVLDPDGGAAIFDPEGKVLNMLALSAVRGAVLDDGSFVLAGRSASGELLVERRTAEGSVLWSRTGRLSSGQAGFTSVNLDSAGNVIATGSFGTDWVVNCPCDSAVLSFEKTELRSIAFQDLFLLKYSATGDLKWALQTEGQDQRLSADIWPFGNPFRLSITRGGPVIHDDGAIGLAGVLTGTVLMGEALLEGGDFSLKEDGSGLYVARITESASPQPSLVAQKGEGGISLKWPSNAVGFVLETANSITGSAWSSVPEAPSPAGDFQEYTISPEGMAKFFRLRKP